MYPYSRETLMRPKNPARLLAQWFHEARSIVVLTGAGMSAESGVPTFRDAQKGLWAQFDPQALATASAYREDKALVWGWYAWRMAMVRSVQPHAGHRALARLSALKSDLVVVTQNVDDLHERAGSLGVIHLHGSLFAARCFDCARPFEGVELPADAIEIPTLRLRPPRCAHCGGDIRPGVVWFGESLPAAAWAQAEASVSRCDLLIAVGTSGVVYPAASLPAMAKDQGARFMEINPVATDLSSIADQVWRTTAGKGLSTVLELLAEG